MLPANADLVQDEGMLFVKQGDDYIGDIRKNEDNAWEFIAKNTGWKKPANIIHGHLQDCFTIPAPASTEKPMLSFEYNPLFDTINILDKERVIGEIASFGGTYRLKTEPHGLRYFAGIHLVEIGQMLDKINAEPTDAH